MWLRRRISLRQPLQGCQLQDKGWKAQRWIHLEQCDLIVGVGKLYIHRGLFLHATVNFLLSQFDLMKEAPCCTSSKAMAENS